MNAKRPAHRRQDKTNLPDSEAEFSASHLLFSLVQVVITTQHLSWFPLLLRSHPTEGSCKQLLEEHPKLFMGSDCSNSNSPQSPHWPFCLCRIGMNLPDPMEALLSRQGGGVVGYVVQVCYASCFLPCFVSAL
jgi:hypothetical protein